MIAASTRQATRTQPRRRRRLKRYIVGRIHLAAVILTFIALVTAVVAIAVNAGDKTSPPTGHDLLGAIGTSVTPAETPGTTSEATTTEPAVFFSMTAEERDLVCKVVSAESRGEPYDGQRAVAQCILNACLKDNIRPAEAIKKYKYTKARVEPTASVLRAVAAVFDNGDFVTEEPILYFYNPKLATSSFHESQTFVAEIQNHRFFKEAE